MIYCQQQVNDITCSHCGVTYHVITDKGDIEQWLSGEGYIQDILHYLSASERELLISRTCNNCWKKLYGETMEEEDE